MKSTEPKKLYNHDSLTVTLMTKLQGLSERCLTTKVLVPLFNALGFDKVDYHGGPYENGKDLICWKTDELGCIELAVAQVKKYQPTSAASDTRCFGEIITQLQQASETPVPNINGQKFYPSMIYFITPFQIETRALQSRFEGYTTLKPRPKIIDGPFLVKLIRENLPQLANELSGKEFLFKDTLTKNLTNTDLLNALNIKLNKDISSFYCDLDFGVGKITTRFFFSLSFKPQIIPLSLIPSSWESFKSCCQLAESFFGVTLISPSEDEIKKDYAQRNEKYESEKKNNKRKPNKKLKSSLEDQPLEPEYLFKLDGRNLAKKLMSKQKWLREQTEKFNSNEPSVSKLRKFLTDCEKLFEAAEKILKDTNISRAIGIYDRQQYSSVEKAARLSVPLHTIFDTRHNFAILGDAGAGKTTSLQMYAKRRSENAGEEELILFVPLARVFAALEKERIKPKGSTPVQLLEYGIISHLRILGLDIIPTEFLLILQTKQVVFLLDGIDEVIKQASWILEAINGLRMRYLNAQIIVSSRMSGDYLDKIPFFGITLLPFTDKQRERFIRGWFNEQSKSKVTCILKHINKFKELGEILRSPLLATILCVLAEHNIPLPDSEIRLYDERMRLLLGHYDIHKQAVRVKSQYYFLELVARKLAYQLHKTGVRQTELEVLHSWAINELAGRLKTELIILAVDELIDPCNILTPMTNDGQIGFGHLRYQEYLAACELKTNRGIGIGQLMHQSWWRGVLVLFAQMTDDVEFIIDWVVKNGKVSDVRETLEAMLAVRPMKERKELRSLISEHVKLDNLDAAFQNDVEMQKTIDEKFDTEFKDIELNDS